MIKKILYIANVRMPTEKAHGVQIIKTCEAMANEGVEVELVVPRRRTHIHEDAFIYYGAKKNFTITRLFCLDTVHLGRIGFLVESASFAIGAAFYARKHLAGVTFGRDESALYAAHLLGVRNIVWETHTGAWNFFARRVAQISRHMVAISSGLKDFYVAHGVNKEKIIVAHDAIDLESFKVSNSKESARVRLGIPQDKKIVLYAGRLDGWKGVSVLFEAAKLLPEDTSVVVIGGEEKQVASLRTLHPRVTFLGFRPYRELADNLSVADVLVLPNTGKDKISTDFTSPLKLFAYMASGVPIVASDLPSLREILSERNAVIVAPDDSEALAGGIIKVLSDKAHATDIASRAKEDAESYTWQKRAVTILRRILKNTLP